jgi:hypothetical protein
MFVIISGSDITKLDLSISTVVAISCDGSQVLVRVETDIGDIATLSDVTDESVSALLSDPFWKQPCVNC